MESLPLEMVELISQYLTPQELAACCATSVGWRDIFNQDSLWKPLCNETTAEYLETTECRVEPGFDSPESQESSLSAICHWRLSFMRENHLYNNWRQGRHVKDELRTEEYLADFTYTFISHDYVIISGGKRVMLWDVRHTPVYLRDPFELLFDCKVYISKIFNNMIAVIQGLSLQVYHFESILDETWHLKHCFFVDEESTNSPNKADQLMAKKYKYAYIQCFSVAIGNIFVGVTSQERNTLHIWDLSKGEKLRRVECPITHEYYNKVTNILTSEDQSKEFVVQIRNTVREGNTYYFYIYSLNQLDFLPFRIKHNLPYYFKRDIKCVLLGKFIAITVNGPIYIYNYLTSELIVTTPTTNSDVLSIGNNILFTEEQKLHMMFSIHSLKVHSLSVTNTNEVPLITKFKREIFGRFFCTVDHFQDLQMWEVGSCKASTNVKWVESFKYCRRYEINKSCTKIIYEPIIYKGYTYEVINLW